MTEMHGIRFTYGDDEPTIEAAIFQAIGFGSVCWSHIEAAGTFHSDLAAQAGEAAIAEVRSILHTRLVGLLDREGVAGEWNDAIEAALCVVGGEPR